MRRQIHGPPASAEQPLANHGLGQALDPNGLLTRTLAADHRHLSARDLGPLRDQLAEGGVGAAFNGGCDDSDQKTAGALADDLVATGAGLNADSELSGGGQG
jgi:hypothetical protein